MLLQVSAIRFPPAGRRDLNPLRNALEKSLDPQSRRAEAWLKGMAVCGIKDQSELTPQFAENRSRGLRSRETVDECAWILSHEEIAMSSDVMNLNGNVAPLTSFSEDEQLFRSSVRDFAEEQIRPCISRMDREARMDADLIRGFFELGLMGVGIPENYGGGGGTFFMAILAVEELSRVDA